MRTFFEHSLWSGGFRAFFALAILSGVIFPPLWILVIHGTIVLSTPLQAVQWHAHEMFYGFGWAVLGGFLLTATKNWLQIPGHSGSSIAVLALMWSLERGVVGYGGSLPRWLFGLGANLYIVSVVALLLYSLIRYRRQDRFDDNYLFLVILPLFLVAKNLMLSADYFDIGANMTLALYRVAFLVMLERTLPAFMLSAFAVTLDRQKWRDVAIKGLAVGLIFAPFLPITVTTATSLALAGALLLRFFSWQPGLGMSRVDIGIMYFGYDGQIAILTVLVERGAENPALQTLWNYLPLERNVDVYPPGATVDLNQFLPEKRGYATYMGSLPTPPCTEGVLWLVMQSPIHVSAAQIGIFSRLYPNNARPIQQQNGRLIKESR